MTREKYHQLCQRYLELRRDRPDRFATKLNTRLLLAVGYLAGLLTLLAVAFGWMLAHTVREKTQIWHICLLVILALPLIAAARGLLARVHKGDGVKLRRRHAPALFDMVDSLRREMHVGKVRSIWLSEDFNAMALQRPLFGLVGLTQFHLILGLPLIAALSPEQVRSVIAHELAHFARDHGRWSRWLNRFWESWGRVRESSTAGWLLVMFEKLDRGRLPALASIHGLHQEFEADAMAADATGADITARSLLRIQLFAAEFERGFAGDYMREALRQETPPPDAITEAIAFVHSHTPDPERCRLHLSSAYGETMQPGESHPPIFERLFQLGAIERTLHPSAAVDAALAIAPPTLETGSLEHFFASPDKLVARWNKRWAKYQTKNWPLLRVEATSAEELLTEIEEKGQAEGISRQDAKWVRVQLTYTVHGPGAGAEALRSFLTVNPHHAEACITMAGELYDLGDERCLTFSQKAAEHDPVYRAAAAALGERWLRQSGQVAQADELASDRFSHEDELDAAETERASLPGSSKFKEPDLTDSELRSLQIQLNDQPAIAKAYIAERVLKHLPEKRHFVLAVKIRRDWWKPQGEDSENSALAELVRTLRFRHLWTAVSIDSVEGRVFRRIRRAAGEPLK